MDATHLDGAPLAVQRGGVWCCLLCKRQFASSDKLDKHIAKSALHAENLAAARKAGRLSDAAARRPPPAAPAAKRASLSSLAAASAVETAFSSKAQYRDRAEERRKLFGSSVLEGSKPMSARDINGNLDWHCGHCKKLNFARTIVCISCCREVDEKTEYIDCTDFQVRRHEGIMKLASRMVERERQGE
ncbi:hypothetical protein AB1Y20_004924 [Prymnesium parvum]|uniref:RanBP2-type domain-containing protein n=1 Tax=Prymnesium parvum TaxID=97485 RepID=A0AB34IYS8_PRYPA